MSYYADSRFLRRGPAMPLDKIEHRGTATTLGRQFAAERCEHAGVGLQLSDRALPVFVALIPLGVQPAAGPSQHRDYSVVIFGFGVRGAPAVQRPPEWRSAIAFIFRINRGAPVKQQLDGVQVSAEGRPVQAGLAVMFESRAELHPPAQQEVDYA